MNSFIFTLLAQQWGGGGLFYARFTYILALLLVSIAYTYWGMFRRKWFAYLFAAAWIYIILIILLVVVARILGLGDPFII
jgi:heme O synthase-like polyprenyltransferase